MNDPLAELARLIGRNDPFSELERDVRSAQVDPDAQDFAASGYVPSTETQPPSLESELARRFDAGRMAPHYDSDPAAYRDGGEPPHFTDDPPQPDWPRNLDANRSYARESFVPPPQSSWAPAAPAYDEDRNYPEPQGQPVSDSYYSDQPAPDRPAFLQALYPQEPAAGFMPLQHEDEFYDEALRPKRRKGFLTVAAVLALAVLGTAGAFGYRTMFGETGSSDPPPVIRASSEPNKVAPATQPVDQTASKFSYDRFGDRGQNERVVVREEQPVESLDLGRSSVPRSALPGASAGFGQPLGVPQARPNPPNAPNPPSALGEPRRVRTVPIRPDQPDSAAVAQSPARQQVSSVRAAPTSAPSPSRQSGTVAEASTDENTPADARASSTRGTPRVAARSVPPAAGRGSENAPLSLSPSNNSEPPSAMAREAPAPRAAAPARGTAATGSNGGGYLVQVSSQRSETDAESSYRSIQSKYSNVLSGQRHLIRRADLGSRGVYYRAMVGPFESREQAIQLCSSLKAVGGDCVVQAN
jgi:hypothetical protein